LIAGTTLSTVGFATMNRTRERSALPFAIIPLIFGIQQLIEGGIWLSFRSDVRSLNSILTYLYALFAFVVWPSFIPFAVASLETVLWRKQSLRLFQATGAIVSLYLLYAHTVSPVVSQVENKSISYNNSHFFNSWIIVLYFVATVGSCLVSSRGGVKLFGIFVFLLALTAYLIYANTFVSVWCFFAAILSITIFLSTRRSASPSHAP
jgi:hypothetical protein